MDEVHELLNYLWNLFCNKKHNLEIHDLHLTLMNQVDISKSFDEIIKLTNNHISIFE